MARAFERFMALGLILTTSTVPQNAAFLPAGRIGSEQCRFELRRRLNGMERIGNREGFLVRRRRVKSSWVVTSMKSIDSQQFARDGFVSVSSVLSLESASALKHQYEDMFAGRFDTGLYPDEWHWREGISLPNAMREICNGWKSDMTVQSVVLDDSWGAMACELMGWAGARVAQDSVLWKPPGGSPVAWHQDAPYISDQFRPSDENSVTIWIALDDADDAVGTMQYARGSHQWPKMPVDASSSSFHVDSDGDDRGAERRRCEHPMRAAAMAAGVPDAEVEVVSVDVPAGSAIIHHQDVWHGSGPNLSADRHRRALAIHLLRADVEFTDSPGYIYGRYKLGEDRSLHESFFPTTFSVPN